MADFRGGNRSGGGRGFERRGFNDRGSRGPVQMHQAVCNKCRKDCEVPFRPTSGRPIYCSSCFETNGGSESRGFENRNSGRPSNFADKQMFEAVCDDCGNNCKVPFRPSDEKPVYCSNCFGDKKGAGERNTGSSQFQHKELFESLNTKLDKILALLTPDTFVQAPALQEEIIEEVADQQVVEKAKPAKKKASKK